MAPANEPVNIHFVDEEIHGIFQALIKYLDVISSNSKADENKHDDGKKEEILPTILIYLIFIGTLVILVILLIFVYKYWKNQKMKVLVGDPRRPEPPQSPPHILREPQTGVLTPTSNQVPPVNNHNLISTIIDPQNADNSDQVPAMKKKKIVYVSKTVDCQTKFPTWKQQPSEQFDSYV